VSKFLLNLLVQIFKALLYSKIQFLSEKNFLQLSTQSAQWPPGPSGLLTLSGQASRAGTSGHAPLPLPPSLTEPVAPPPPPLTPLRCPSPAPWSDPNGGPLLNSAVCLYSVVNPPLFTMCNRRLHGRPLKPPQRLRLPPAPIKG
jgi:hypothetical protein